MNEPQQTSIDYPSARDSMVYHQLRARGIRDERVLEAMAAVPREHFVPDDLRPYAYEDRAMPVGQGQTISQPFMVAYMSEQLGLKPAHRVLEIGTGTGYQTAVLAHLAADVYSVERIEPLLADARTRLESLDIRNVHLHCGDGSRGWPDHAPYDRILVTAGAPSVPQPLVDQLNEGGWLVAPVGGADQQSLIRLEKRKGRTIEVPLIACRFVRLIGESGWRAD